MDVGLILFNIMEAEQVLMNEMWGNWENVNEKITHANHFLDFSARFAILAIQHFANQLLQNWRPFTGTCCGHLEDENGHSLEFFFFKKVINKQIIKEYKFFFC